MDNGHWKCYSKNINHLYFTFNEKDVFIILHCLGEPFDVTLSVCVRLGASMTKAFWTKQGTVAWHIAVRFAIFLQRAAHKLAIFSAGETRAEKSVCSKPRFLTALSDSLFNKSKNGRNFEDLFQACALLLPVTFLTGSHVCKSDLTRSRLWLCQQEIWEQDYFHLRVIIDIP